jgi:hypothetical protein
MSHVAPQKKEKPYLNYEQDVLYKPLVKLIKKYESTSHGGLNAFNLGGEQGGHKPIGSGNSTTDPLGGTIKPLTERTVGEVSQLWKNARDRTNPYYVWATGDWQLIPGTGEAVQRGDYGPIDVKDTDLFDARTQWKFGKALIDYRLRGNAPGFKKEWLGLSNVSTPELQSAINQVRLNLSNFNELSKEQQASTTLQYEDPKAYAYKQNSQARINKGDIAIGTMAIKDGVQKHYSGKDLGFQTRPTYNKLVKENYFDQNPLSRTFKNLTGQQTGLTIK